MKHRDIIPPVHISSTYEVSWDEARALALGETDVPFYARYGNPTLQAVEQKIAAFCGGEDALVVASGMAAISLVPFALLQPGDEILATRTLYGGTSNLLAMVERWGISTNYTECDLSDAEANISSRTKLLWLESPANPTNRIVSFDRAVRLAREHNLISVVDATLGPPPLQHPLSHGIDLELHSATKYFGGHSDLLAGAVVGGKELLAKLRATHRILGAVLDARAAAELLRGLQTLPLRTQHISATALQLAQKLEAHSKVARVHYPHLQSHPDYDVAYEQMSAGGGILSFDLVENSEPAARRFVEALQIVRHAPSLGGTESLVSYPPLSSHANQSDEALASAGITRGTLRLSIGLETENELWRDIVGALSAV
ncbi:MAG TPA: aminotransferase class I/II-fold pyridoxal phosphate-dependent enzyme [Abditibacteriaceae bacterium]|jgi:cystathionine beta-lyase/cystathionine gamma-synthase